MRQDSVRWITVISSLKYRFLVLGCAICLILVGRLVHQLAQPLVFINNNLGVFRPAVRDGQLYLTTTSHISVDAGKALPLGLATTRTTEHDDDQAIASSLAITTSPPSAITTTTSTTSPTTLTKLSTSSTLSTLIKQSKTVLPSSIISSLSTVHAPKNVLVIRMMGRTGNHMFQYAAAYAMARRSGRQLVCAGNFVMAREFQLGSVKTVSVTSTLVTQLPLISEKFCCTFDRDLYNKSKSINSPGGVVVHGFLQSWMYFQDYFTDIRSMLTFFRPHVVSKINRFYASISESTSSFNSLSMSSITDNNKANSSASSAAYFLPKYQNHTTFVGVHVRRQDMKVEKLINYGFSTGDSEFIGRAMLHFIKRYSHVTFIVCSDDVAWCRKHIVLPEMFADSFAIHYCSSDDSATVHLGILAACSHSILSGGTFGWWAAFLAGGEAVFYSGYPRPGSQFSKAFSKSRSDYYLPGWVGMS